MSRIVQVLNADSFIKAFKAPKGKMYAISDIHGTVNLAGDNLVSVFDYLKEDLSADVGPSLSDEGVLANFATNIAGNHIDFNFMIPQTCKFISIGSESATAFEAILIIAYELITASRTQLLIEWLRKGR